MRTPSEIVAGIIEDQQITRGDVLELISSCQTREEAVDLISSTFSDFNPSSAGYSHSRAEFILRIIGDLDSYKEWV